MNASWKKGYPAKADAFKCYQELERLRAEHGFLNKEIVKEAARDSSNVLHKEVFNCGEGEASERYYSDRAAGVIRSIEIQRIETPQKPTRAYEITTTVEAKEVKKVYRTTEEIMEDPSTRAELLGNAITDIHKLRSRYYMLQELAKVFAAMDVVLKTV